AQDGYQCECPDQTRQVDQPVHHAGSNAYANDDSKHGENAAADGKKAQPKSEEGEAALQWVHNGIPKSRGDNLLTQNLTKQGQKRIGQLLHQYTIGDGASKGHTRSSQTASIPRPAPFRIDLHL